MRQQCGQCWSQPMPLDQIYPGIDEIHYDIRDMYLLQQTPYWDQQNLSSLFLPVYDTQSTFSSLLKAKPDGPLRHRNTIGLILCCCMSMMNTLPLAFGMCVYPSGPESVKKTLPVLFDISIELGPYRSCPSYQFTSYASEKSFAFTAIIDCFRRSAIQNVFLGVSNAIDLICPFIFVSSFNCPYAYFIISPLYEQMRRLSSIQIGEYRGEFIYKIFYVFVNENIEADLNA